MDGEMDMTYHTPLSALVYKQYRGNRILNRTKNSIPVRESEFRIATSFIQRRSMEFTHLNRGISPGILVFCNKKIKHVTSV